MGPLKSLCLAALSAVIQSYQFGHSVVSDSLWPHGLQHARLPCPSTTPRVFSNSCPLCRWCHPTISSSVVPFTSCLQSFPASESFPMSQFFISGGQSIEVSASASVLPMNIQDWFPKDWLVWSPCCPRDSQESSLTPKTIVLTRWTFVGKVMSLLFNMLSSLVITFLPRSKCLLISWLQSLLILEPPKNKVCDFGAPKNKDCHCFHCLPIYLPWSDGTTCHDLSFLNVEF